MWIRLTFAMSVCLSWAAWAGPSYLDSKGRQVELHPAPDRVRVRANEDQLAALRQRFGALTVEPGGWVELSLGAGDWGDPAGLIRRLHSEGNIERAAMVFSDPVSNIHFSLDRAVVVRLRHPAKLFPAVLLEGSALTPEGPLDRRGELWSLLGADAEAALTGARRLAGRAGVVWALPDFRVPVQLYRRPNDPYYDRQWYLGAAGTTGHIQAEAAWDVTQGDARVVVAVVDTGVDTAHPDFGPGALVEGYDAVTGDSDPTPGATTMDAHGTCCSGLVMAAADNGEGMAGVCPGCSLMPIRLMDGMSSAAQLSTGYRALNHAADEGAWVVSNSWGITADAMGQVDMQPYYQAVRHAAEDCRDGLGAVVLFASGNGDFMGNATTIGDAELANMAEVMAIGGTGQDDRVVSYSNYGPNLSVVAPTGHGDPTVFGMFTTDTLGDRGFSRAGSWWMPGFWGDQNTGTAEPDSTGNYTAYFNGTSAACPVAAGVVGLVFSSNPNLTGAQARRIVEGTADKVGGVTYGPDGHNDHYGQGRINAHRAVLAAPYGVDGPEGAACAEDVNCLGGSCWKLEPESPSGICAGLCVVDSDCLAGFACASVAGGQSRCLPACAQHSDCGEAAVCLEGACQQVACSDGSECPDGSACPIGIDGSRCSPICTDDEECIPPFLCLPAGGGDLCQHITCLTLRDCPVGTICLSDQCERPVDEEQADEGSGGCGCATNPAMPGGLLVLLVVLLLVRRRALRQFLQRRSLG